MCGHIHNGHFCPSVRTSPVVIGGNDRAYSPSHPAKYSSYRIIDMNTNKIIHIDLV